MITWFGTWGSVGCNEDSIGLVIRLSCGFMVQGLIGFMQVSRN